MSSGDDIEYETMCQTCTVRPAYRGYRHCSKTCAEKVSRSDRPRRIMDEEDDEQGEDISARMGRLSVKAPSAKVRLCIVCKETPAVGAQMFCSKACKTDHSRKGSPRAAVSSNQYSEEEEDYGSFEQEDKRERRRPDPRPARKRISDREPSDSTALARRPPMCMYCRRNPKVGDSAFCGRRCMQDAMAELGGRPAPSSGSRNRRDTQSYQYQNNSQMFADSVQSPDWYQGGYGAAPYGQAYSGYNQPQQAYPPAQPSYHVPQQSYPAPQPYYPQMPWPAYPSQPAGPPCAIAGCKAVAFNGSKYCGQACRKDAVTKGLEPACLLCKVNPKNFRKHFCSRDCGTKAENQAPMLLDVPATDPKFADIVKQFNDTWKGGYGTRGTALVGAPPPGNPTIKRVCKVVNTKAVEVRYQAYRKQVEATGNFAAQGKPEGNEMRRWHGTQRVCTVGDTAANLTPCTNAACRLCCIIRVSFQTANSVCQANGIYTSAFSGVSNGYTRAATAGSPHKAMFLTRIVVGKRHVGNYLPVAGTDSTAIDNMDSELIVFKNDAILPSWLVLYS